MCRIQANLVSTKQKEEVMRKEKIATLLKNVPPERSHSDGIGLPERKYSRKVTARSQSIPTAHPDNHPSPPVSPLTRAFFVAPRAARAAGSLALRLCPRRHRFQIDVPHLNVVDVIVVRPRARNRGECLRRPGHGACARWQEVACALRRLK